MYNSIFVDWHKILYLQINIGYMHYTYEFGDPYHFHIQIKILYLQNIDVHSRVLFVKYHIITARQIQHINV